MRNLVTRYHYGFWDTTALNVCDYAFCDVRMDAVCHAEAKYLHNFYAAKTVSSFQFELSSV